MFFDLLQAHEKYSVGRLVPLKLLAMLEKSLQIVMKTIKASQILLGTQELCES